MDERDEAILSALGADGRISEKKISRRTRIPMTTVHNRLKKLKQDGVIKKFTIMVDGAKLGRPITAFVMVKAAPQAEQSALLARIAGKPRVLEASMITGEFDILFKAQVANMEELNRLVVGDLRRDKMVSETRTMISYETREAANSF